MASKAKTLLWGMFGYKRTPAAEIDGGMAEYVFQQFQELPPQNVITGRGYIFRHDLLLTEPGLFVFAPVGAPYDVTKIPVGDPLIAEELSYEDIQP